jgi:hypothetical protein
MNMISRVLESMVNILVFTLDEKSIEVT